MTLVRKVEGEWTPVAGVVDLQRTVATCAIVRHYADGRQEPGGEEACEPYTVTEQVNTGKVAALVRDCVWGAEDLAAYGLKVAEPFIPPEGKEAVGAPRYVEADGAVREEFDVEDIPPPPKPPTAEERVAAAFAGLTVDEVDQVIAASLARQAEKAKG